MKFTFDKSGKNGHIFSTKAMMEGETCLDENESFKDYGIT